MKKFTTAVAVTLLGAAIAFAAPQAENGWHHHGKRGEFARKFAQELNLTDAQKAQIRDIRKTTREENKAFFEQSRATMKEFWTAKKANDTAKMNELKPTVDANRAQMKQIRAAEDEKIAAVLTPEQNAKWQQMKADRAARHEQRKRDNQ